MNLGILVVFLRRTHLGGPLPQDFGSSVCSGQGRLLPLVGLWWLWFLRLEPDMGWPCPCPHLFYVFALGTYIKSPSYPHFHEILVSVIPALDSSNGMTERAASQRCPSYANLQRHSLATRRSAYPSVRFRRSLRGCFCQCWDVSPLFCSHLFAKMPVGEVNESEKSTDVRDFSTVLGLGGHPKD